MCLLLERGLEFAEIIDSLEEHIDVVGDVSQCELQWETHQLQGIHKWPHLVHYLRPDNRFSQISLTIGFEGTDFLKTCRSKIGPKFGPLALLFS